MPLGYSGKITLQPEELLLYCLFKITSPSNSLNFVNVDWKSEKYFTITRAIFKVYGIRFNCASIQNYFYRSINNITKGLGKLNGHLRWNIYSSYIDSIILAHKSELFNLLLNSDSNTILSNLQNDLEKECLASMKESTIHQGLAYTIVKVSDHLASKFPKWKVIPDVEKSTTTLLFMGNSHVYAEYEVIISPDGSYSFFFMSTPKDLNLDFNLVPAAVHNKNQLYLLMKYLEKFQVCSGVSVEKYIYILPDSHDTPVYKTVDGKPAAFVELSPSSFPDKLIRPVQCDMLIKDVMCCKACSVTHHYMRTLKSRSQNAVEEDNLNSKHTRYNYMSRDKLIEHSRQMAGEMHLMQVKLKRLETYQKEMSTVGSETDSDFRDLFKQLYKGLHKNIEERDDNACYWDGCHLEEECKSPESLFAHIKNVHIPTVDDVAPIDRKYTCEWLGCKKQFGKKKLLHTHLSEHTGRESDTFFITLLKDQAKALNMPSRQMRWHPLVLKWCLRIYSKSHSIYSEVRESGFLKLPSGRTLSDYKNFCSSKSGWQTSMLQAMKNSFVEQKIPEVGKFGALFFDEVKIKEGLLFDPSSWELIGFTDLDSEHVSANSPMPSVQEKLATHVLQFYFKSLLSSFQFPCSHFLTRGVKAHSLNRTFWQGVGLLHGCGFQVILACCDGAAENRAFMVMNGCSETVSKTNNPFSNLPLFFMSDPPHLIKKLRNNLYNSGFKANASRYTRCLLLNSKNILWDHVYSVYLREKQRHLFATDLRNSHVHLDSLSKMRVKLAVQVLNSKVQKDMEKFEPTVTESTQTFVYNCNKLWSAFNDNKPLASITDSRIKDLDEVLQFFNNWKSELAIVFPIKTERSSHFITWQTMFDLQVN